MKKYLLMLASAAMAAALLFACQKPAGEEEEENPEEIELEALECEVTATENWIFDGKPEFTLTMTNPNKKEVTANIGIWVSTDKKEGKYNTQESITVPAKATKNYTISPTGNYEPGFYKLTVKVDKKYHERQRFRRGATEPCFCARHAAELRQLLGGSEGSAPRYNRQGQL